MKVKFITDGTQKSEIFTYFCPIPNCNTIINEFFDLDSRKIVAFLITYQFSLPKSKYIVLGFDIVAMVTG